MMVFIFTFWSFKSHPKHLVWESKTRLTERTLGREMMSEKEMCGKRDQEERECVWGSKDASERGRSVRRNTKDA